MAIIESIATQSVDEKGTIEKLRFREETDIYDHTRYVMKGNGANRPLYASARGFVRSKDDPLQISEEMIEVQEIHKKTTGIRVRGEILSVGKDELNGNKFAQIKDIANEFCDYYMGRGHQAAYGIYDRGKSYEVIFSINTVNFADGSKYRHNNHDIQDEEEACLATVVADVTGKDLQREERFDFETLKYTP